MDLQTYKQQWDPQETPMTCIKGGRGSGKVFAAAFEDKSVKVFVMGPSSPALDLPGLEAKGTGLAFNHTEEVLAGGDERGTVTLWSLKQGKVARTLEGGSKMVTEIAFHPSGSFAAVAGHDLTTRVWDLREKRCVQTYSAHEKTTCISFSPGAGGFIMSGGVSGLTKVWDVRAGKIITTLKKHKGAVNDLAFHPTERVLATGGDDGVVHFWSADDYSKISSSSTFKEGVKGLDFSSDGKAAIAVSDSNLRVMSWDPHSIIDSVASMPWGSVRDAFIRKDKLFVASVSKDGKTPQSSVLILSSGIKPFAADTENIAPVESVAEKKPEQPKEEPKEDPVEEPKAEDPKVEPQEEQQQEEVAVEDAPVETPVEKKAAPVVEEPVVVVAKKESVAIEKPEPLKEKKKKVKSESSIRKPEEQRRSGSHRSASSSSSSSSGSHRSSSSSRSRKDSTKPSHSVVPAQSVGFVPADRNTALGLKAEDFRRRTKAAQTDEQILELCMEDHSNMCAALSTRKTHVTAIRALWTKESIWKAVSQMQEARELSVVVDVLSNLSTQQLSIIPLEMLNVVLTQVQCLLQSEYEDYCVLGCTLLRGINKIFGSSLKSTRDKAHEARNDAVIAERLEIVQACYETLNKCSLQLRENLGCGGRVGSSSREILALFRRLGVQ